MQTCAQLLNKKSTQHALIKAVENREKSCFVFLDFAKVHDTVNHDILFKKLKIMAFLAHH